MVCMELHTDFRMCNLGGSYFGELTPPGFPAPSAHLEEGFLREGKTNLECKPNAIAQAWREGGARALHLQELFSVLPGFLTPTPGCP